MANHKNTFLCKDVLHKNIKYLFVGRYFSHDCKLSFYHVSQFVPTVQTNPITNLHCLTKNKLQ